MVHTANIVVVAICVLGVQSSAAVAQNQPVAVVERPNDQSMLTLISKQEVQDALAKAIANEDRTAIARAIKRGADVNAPLNAVGTLPLELAVLNQWVKSVRSLLEFGAIPNKSLSVPSELLQGFEEQTGIELSSPQALPLLHVAIRDRNPKIVQLLVDFGADTGAVINGQTALDLAWEKGNTTIIDILRRAAKK